MALIPTCGGGGTCGAPAPQNLPDALRQEVHAYGRGEVCQLKAKCAQISARGLDSGPTEWLGVSLLLGWMGGTRRLSLSYLWHVSFFSSDLSLKVLWIPPVPPQTHNSLLSTTAAPSLPPPQGELCSHPPAAHCLHGAGQGASGQPCFPFVWEEKSCSSVGFGAGSTLRGRAVPDGTPTPQLGVGRGCRLTAAMATWLPTTSAFLFQFNPCPSWLRDLPSAKPRITERNNLVLHQASFHGLLLQCRWLPVLLHPALPIPTCLNSFGGGPVLSGVRGGRKETSKGP